VKQPSAILIAARALIADPARWTTKEFARRLGEPADPLDAEAERWCALGALHRAAGTPIGFAADSFDIAHVFLGAAIHGDYSLIEDVNDNGGHDATLALYDRAIAAALAAEAVTS
jgi:hypothetical protein